MATSPKFNGNDMEHFFDPNFTEEISHKMQVPKRIKVNGDNEDDIVIGVGGNQPVSAWHNDKIDMHVPDRILVIDIQPTEMEFEVRNENAKNSNQIQFWNDGVLLNRPSYAVLKSQQKHRNHARLTATRSKVNSNLQSPYLRSIRSESFLTGQDEFSGSRGQPIESSHENAVLRPEMERVRVQTPPSTITMHEYNFPSAVDDLAGPPDLAGTPPAQGFVRPKGRRPPYETAAEEEAGDSRLRSHDYSAVYSRGGMDSRNDSFISNDRYRMQPLSQYREGTPPLTDGMSANEEIAHLRRQLAKLNRRVMSIELENLQRQQYEKIACALSVGYIVWKTLLWLKSSS